VPFPATVCAEGGGLKEESTLSARSETILHGANNPQKPKPRRGEGEDKILRGGNDRRSEKRETKKGTLPVWQGKLPSPLKCGGGEYFFVRRERTEGKVAGGGESSEEKRELSHEKACLGKGRVRRVVTFFY